LTVSDGSLTGQDSDTPAITPTNDAPTIDVVANDFVENSASDGDIAATYTTHDEDGDALTVDFTPGTNDNGYYAIVNGQVVLTQAGADFVNNGGTLPAVDLTVSDGSLTGQDSDTPEITPTNDAPVAQDDRFNVNEGAVVSGNLIADNSNGVDSDPENDPLSITHVNNTQLVFDQDGWSQTLTVEGGTVRVKADGTFEYAHDGSEPTPTDPSFTYTLSDGSLSDVGEVTFEVGAVNDKPTIKSVTNTRVSEEGLVDGVTDTTGNTDTTDSVTASGSINIEDLDGDTLSVSLSGPVTAMTSGGESINWAWDADTGTLTGSIGVAGTDSYQEVMTVKLTAPDGNSSGEWSYDVTLLAPVDHVDPTSEDNLSLDFGISVDDGDGGTTDGSFNVIIEDDAPEAHINDLVADNVAHIDGYTGTLTVKGADNNYSADLTGNVTGWSDEVGSELYFADSGLTTGGETIYYFIDPATPDVMIAYTSTTSAVYGDAGADQSVVFTLSVDPNSGEYVLNLEQPITEVISTSADLTGTIPGGNDEDLFILLQGSVVGEVNVNDQIQCSITATDINGAIDTVNTSPNGIGVGTGKDIGDGETLILTFSGPVTDNLSLTLSHNNGNEYTGNATFYVSGVDANGVAITDTFVGTSAEFTTYLSNSPIAEINLIQLSTASDGSDFNLQSLNTETITVDTSGTTLDFTVDIIDGDGDVDSDNDFSVTLNAPSALTALTPYGFASLDEATLLSDAADNDTETLLFKAGDSEINSFSFGDTSNIEVQGIRQPMSWRIEDGKLIGSMNGRGDLLKLTLDWDAIAAGQQGTVVLDAELLGKMPHNIDVDNLLITGIEVIAADASGSNATSSVTVSVADNNLAPLATDDYFGVGLNSHYYSYNDSTDGGNLSSVSQVRDFINSNEADATFFATTLNYAWGNGNLGTGNSLQQFLGDDAASLSNDPGNSSDAILHMQGSVQLDAGTYGLKVTADDGYSVLINGVVVAQVSRNQSSSTRLPGDDGHIYFDITDSGAHSIEVIYWDQGGAYQLNIELGEFDQNNQQIGDYTPLGDQIIANGVVVLEDTPFTFSADSILANDTDPDGDLLSIISVGNAENGTVELDADGNVVFTPDTGYSGSASYEYTVQDEDGLTDTATVYFDVIPTRDYGFVGGTDGDNTLQGSDDHDVIVSDTTGLQIVAGEDYNIAFILDSSGSMGTSAVNTAKSQLIEVFRTLQASTSGEYSGTVNIAVIDFSGSATTSISLNIQDLDIDALVNGSNSAWNNITNGGSTDYIDAFNATTDWFSSSLVTNNPGNNITYFITDGEHNQGGDPLGAFNLLNAISEVEAVGIKQSIDAEDIVAYDSDGNVQAKVSVDNLASVILGSETTLLQGDDQTTGGQGNDIIFGDLTQFTGIEGQGFTALQAFVAQETNADTNSVTVQEIHAFITANPEMFNITNTNDGADTLEGGEGNDILFGQGGNDTLIGGLDNDTMIGGLGDDKLTGNEGSDTFVWTTNSVDGTDTTDHITDFNLAEDKLDLSDILQGDTVNELAQHLSFTNENGSTSINIDTDGNGSFDQHIVLDGVDLIGQFGNDEADIISGLLGNNGEGPLIVSTSTGDPVTQSVNTPDPLDDQFSPNGFNLVP
ncbi:Ig-like domain-containing protein, partial [Shewanella schlegeliana]